MANNFFGNVNYLDSTFYNVVISGGSYDATQNLEKLRTEDLNDVAVSADDDPDNTQLYVDLGAPRDVRMFAIPNNINTFNPSLNAQHRIRGSNTPLWTGLQVNGAHSAGASSLSVENTTASDITVTTGDVFSVRTTLGTGERVWSTYEATGTVVISASSTGSISVTPNLAQDHADDDTIECNHGDFTSPVKSFGWEDIFEPIYPYGSLPWGHPSFWGGKPTEEQRLNLPFPIVKVFSPVLARYWHYEIDDEGHRPWNDPKIHIPRLFIGNGYQPTLNPSYQGTRFDFLTETTVDTTLGGRRIYGEEPIARKYICSIPDIGEDEAFSRPFDMQWQDGLSKQVMFVFDPDDSTLMHRRAFLATQEKLNAIEFPYFSKNNFSFELLEVL